MKDLNFAPSRLRVNELLEQHFDTAFAAPNGIKKLRELILTLAMQGKLVAQDANDPPASQLLKEIAAEKLRLVKEGKIKDGGTRRREDAKEIKAEDVPYVLPQGWEWVRLGEICEYNGRDNVAPESIAHDAWLLDLEDIEKNTSRLIYRAKYSERQSKSTKSTFQKGDVLYGKLRPYLDKVIVADTEGVCTTEIVPIVPSHAINSEFLKLLLKRPAFLSHVNSLMYGVKMPRLGTEDAVQSIHPLPPISEQQRIVAKIDQLMARCDALERLRDEREHKRRSVHAAVLKQLLEESSSPSFAPSRLRVSQFFFDHFGELYAVRENVTALRKAILQLAVMGKLVPQNPNDPPASQLLQEIEAEKKRLVKEGKIRVTRSREDAKEIKAEEVPYALPQGWEWVRLGDIGISQTGTTPPSKDAENLGDFIPFIGPGDIKNNVINYSGEGLSEIGLSNGRLIEKGSVLMVCIGGSIGKHAVNDRGVTCNQQINTLTPYNSVSVNFVFYAMGAEWFQKNVVAKAGGSATPIINKQKWSSILVPLPPTFEQHRIVAKIDQLMALCDTLEQQIDAASGKQTALLDAVMAQV